MNVLGTTALATLAIALVGASTSAQRQGRPSPPPHVLERLDADGDGRVDRGELKSAKEERGAERRGRGAKRGGQGEKVRGKIRGKIREKIRSKVDADGDGKCSPKEKARAKKQLRDRVDGNGDGRISKRERAAARAKLRRGLKGARAKGEGRPAGPVSPRGIRRPH